jgi:MFS family permease
MSFIGDLRAVVRQRDFRRLYATRLVSQAADGAFQVALASVFFFAPERQTSAGAVAAAFATLLLPYSLVGPFAGVLLDRWRRRQVLVRANLLRAVMMLGVAALVLAGIGGPVLYAFVLACLSVNRFFLAGLSAALPHVVHRAELVMANSVSTTSGTVVAILGGAVGVGLRLLLGEGRGTDAGIVALASAAYVASAAVASRMDRDLLGPDLSTEPPETARALRHVAVGLVDGGRHVLARRPAGFALAAIGGHRVGYGLSTIVTILLCRNYFTAPSEVDAGIALLGAVFFASGIGIFLAAVLTPLVTARLRKSTWMVVCFAGAGAVEMLFVAWLSVPLMLVGALVLGIAAQGAKICVDTIVQEAIEDAFRGRVFSFYDVLFNVAFVSAAALAVLVVPTDGYSPLLYAGIAAGYLLTAVAYRVASNKHPEPDDRPTPPSPSTPTSPAPPLPPPRPRQERARAKRRRVVTRTLQS